MSPIWAAFLAELFKTLTGMVNDWLKRRMAGVAADMPPPDPDSERATADVLREVRRSLWPLIERRRIKYVERMLAVAPRAVGRGAVTLAEQEAVTFVMAD